MSALTRILILIVVLAAITCGCRTARRDEVKAGNGGAFDGEWTAGNSEVLSLRVRDGYVCGLSARFRTGVFVDKQLAQIHVSDWYPGAEVDRGKFSMTSTIQVQCLPRTQSQTAQVELRGEFTSRFQGKVRLKVTIPRPAGGPPDEFLLEETVSKKLIAH